MDEYRDLLFKIVEGQGRIEQKVDNYAVQTAKNCADIEVLKSKPARRWEMFVATVVSTVVAAVVAIFTKKI